PSSTNALPRRQPGMSAFERLLSPVSIGAMRLRNRIVMSAMTTNYGTPDMQVSERLIRYHEARAAGGVGLITVEMCSVDSAQRYQPQSLSLGEDRFIPGHRELVRRVHALGACIQPQISHPGPESMSDPVGPSVNVNAGTGWPSRVMDLAEMRRVLGLYGDAACRAREAGYDGMELHAAHAYMLLGSFLSPTRNRREDDYSGATREGRTRLLLEAIATIRERVGADWPITLRISGYEDTWDGRELADTQMIAPQLVAAGISAIQVSGGVSHDRIVGQIVCGSDYRDGYNVAVARAIRRVVDVPVVVVGRIHDPQQAEAILAVGAADLIAMARPLLADPELPNKLRSGRVRELRRCLSCQNCIDSMLIAPFDANMNCAVNAQSGREEALAITPAAVPRRVVVVGGGTAGMEAARVAALRGHRVTLLERSARLGGSLVFAATVHADNEPLLYYLRHQMPLRGVDVRLGVQADEAALAALSPDAVIVCTGARVLVPELPGSHLPHVTSGEALRALLEGADAPGLRPVQRFLATRLMPPLQRWLSPGLMRRLGRAWMPLGHRVAVLGSDLAAVELAEFLAERGRRVSLLGEGEVFAPDVGPKRRQEQLRRLDRLGVEVLGGLVYHEITPQGVRAGCGGRDLQLAADSVVLAGEPRGNGTLAERFRAAGFRVLVAGDCNGPGLIRKAVEEGMRAALEV
ncbi:MAG: FAD-dependent oxidoreductase, partial [Gammaproteobacteria bacterium]